MRSDELPRFPEGALEALGIRPRPLRSQPAAATPPPPAVLRVPRRAVVLGFVAGATVLALGFLFLLCFWLLGEPRPDVPGLFDYAAATLGDGLLLPLLAFACVLVLASPPPAEPGDRAWALAAGAAGLAAGGIVQLLWLLDPDPHLNWTLVSPHEQNTAGWWHTGFFVLAAGFFAACAGALGRRIRRLSEPGRRALVESGWLAAVAFCALGFLGLATVDNLAATDTQAGLATAAGVAAGGGLFAIGSLWAFRFSLREVVPELLLGAGGGAGLALLAAFGLALPWGAAVIGSLLALGLGVGLNASALAGGLEAAGGMRRQLLAATAVRSLLAASTLVGSLALGVELAGEDGLLAALAVVLGAAIASLTSRGALASPPNAALRTTAVAYSIGLVVLAGWVGEGRDSAEANYAAGFAAFFLDGLVLGMIREQFARVIRSDLLGRDESGRGTEEVGLDTLVQVYAFGSAALAALATLFAVAAEPLGLDVGGGFPDVDYPALGAALALALGLTIAARVLARRAARKRGLEHPFTVGSPPAIHPPALALALTGLAVWTAAIVWSVTAVGPTMVLPAAVGAALIGLMAIEDVVRSCTRLQLHSPDRWSKILSGAVGATVAAGVFFVLSTGLWDEGEPASAAATVLSLAVPFSTIFIAWLATSPLAFGLRAENVTPQTPSSNVLLIQGLYAALALIALILPMVAVGRIDALDPADSGLVATTALAALPPLIGAFVWVLGNNTLHLELQLHRLQKASEPPPPLDSFESPGGFSAAERWASWMSTHIRFQNRFAVLVILTGFAWAAIRILA